MNKKYYPKIINFIIFIWIFLFSLFFICSIFSFEDISSQPQAHNSSVIKENNSINKKNQELLETDSKTNLNSSNKKENSIYIKKDKEKNVLKDNNDLDNKNDSDIYETVLINILDEEDTKNNTSTQPSEYIIKEQEETLYSSCSLNIRSLPDINSDIIGKFSTNDKVEQIGITDNGWSQVLFDETKGFCKSKYLSKNTITFNQNNTDDSSLVPDNSNLTNTANISNPHIIIEPNAKQEVISKATTYYNYIPSNIRSYFENDGWNFVICNGNLGSRFGYSFSVAGLTDFYGKRIYTDNRTSYTVITSVVHEMGHYIDYVLGGKSPVNCSGVQVSPEFTAIRNSEVSNYLSFHSTHPNNVATNQEYFAECFQSYCLEKAQLQQYCPSTYNYIDNIVHTLF